MIDCRLSIVSDSSMSRVIVLQASVVTKMCMPPLSRNFATTLSFQNHFVLSAALPFITFVDANTNKRHSATVFYSCQSRHTKHREQRQIQKSREAYTLFDYGNASVTTRAPSKHNACTHHRRGQVQTTAHVKCTHEKTKTHNKMSMHLSKTNAKKLQQNVQRRLGN